MVDGVVNWRHNPIVVLNYVGEIHTTIIKAHQEIKMKTCYGLLVLVKLV